MSINGPEGGTQRGGDFQLAFKAEGNLTPKPPEAERIENNRKKLLTVIGEPKKGDLGDKHFWEYLARLSDSDFAKFVAAQEKARDQGLTQVHTDWSDESKSYSVPNYQLPPRLQDSYYAIKSQLESGTQPYVCNEQTRIPTTPYSFHEDQRIRLTSIQDILEVQYLIQRLLFLKGIINKESSRKTRNLLREIVENKINKDYQPIMDLVGFGEEDIKRIKNMYQQIIQEQTEPFQSERTLLESQIIEISAGQSLSDASSEILERVLGLRKQIETVDEKIKESTIEALYLLEEKLSQASKSKI